MPADNSKERSYTHMSETEKTQIKRWSGESLGPTAIAERLSRGVSTVKDFRAKWKAGKEGPGSGRPPALTDAQKKRLAEKAIKMVEASNAEYQVTTDMLRTAMKVECCDKVR